VVTKKFTPWPLSWEEKRGTGFSIFIKLVGTLFIFLRELIAI
jgi:hypothetical protein